MAKTGSTEPMGPNNYLNAGNHHETYTSDTPKVAPHHVLQYAPICCKIGDLLDQK